MALKLARTTTIGLTSVFFITVLAAISLPGAAQVQPGTATAVITLTNKDFGSAAPDRLSPETELGEVTVKVDITVSGVGAGCIIPYTVTFTTTSAIPYASQVMNPSVATNTVTTSNSANPSGGGDKTFVSSTLLVTTTRDAPAFKDDQYKVKATVAFGNTQQVCLVTAPGAIEGTTTVKNDYLPLTQLAPAQYFQKSGQNKKVTFPVEVTNLGNGPSRVKIEVSQPNKNKLDSITPPADLHLESRSKGAQAQYKLTPRIEAQTPHSNGYTNSIYSFNVKFSTSYDGSAQGTATDESSLVLSVQVQGVYVPGFDPTSAIAALGIAIGAIAIRRKAD